MQVINWLELQPLLADVDTLNARLREARPVWEVCRSLVGITLGGYPWQGRSDLIPFYHPARTYRPGQWLAIPDPRDLCPVAWQVARVKVAEQTGNPVQGRFQALVLDVNGREVQKTAGLAGADYPEPGLGGCTPEELGRLGDWVADTYAGALLATLKKLIQKGRIFGHIETETFLPEQMFALSADRLAPFFARLSPSLRWVSLEEIVQGLPDLASLKRDTALALVRSTLKVSPYRALGGDRWTTPDLFDQLDREVPCGLPAAGQRTKVPLWTGQDRKDLAAFRTKPIPDESVAALEELGLEEARSEPDLGPLTPPEGPLRLPALSTLHLTQACFPAGPVMHAFPPEARMIFVQLMHGGHQPYLVDREQRLLKAVHPEALQDQILEAGLPAGTQLWLEYEGGEGYRIFPRPLAMPRRVPCRRASLCEGRLQIEPSHFQVEYESEASIFKVDLLSEDIRALHGEARRSGLSLRDAMISVVQDLSAADPRGIASRPDILNAVFLKRSCSPQAAAVLLYGLPCFESLKGGGFRYRPMVQPSAMNIWKQDNRVTRLWEELAVNDVAPDPKGRKMIAREAAWATDSSFSFELVPDTGASSPLDSAAMEEPASVRSLIPVRYEESQIKETSLLESIALEPVQLIKQVLEVFIAPPDEEPAADQSEEIDRLILPGETEELEETHLPPVQAVYGHYPAMVKVSLEPEQPASSIDTRRLAHGLKVPARPLHKRPFYQRIFFCLRGWLHLVSGRNHDPSAR